MTDTIYDDFNYDNALYDGSEIITTLEEPSLKVDSEGKSSNLKLKIDHGYC